MEKNQLEVKSEADAQGGIKEYIYGGQVYQCNWEGGITRTQGHEAVSCESRLCRLVLARARACLMFWIAGLVSSVAAVAPGSSSVSKRIWINAAAKRANLNEPRLIKKENSMQIRNENSQLKGKNYDGCGIRTHALSN